MSNERNIEVVDGGLKARKSGEHEAGRKNGYLGYMKSLKSSAVFEKLEKTEKG